MMATTMITMATIATVMIAASSKSSGISNMVVKGETKAVTARAVTAA